MVRYVARLVLVVGYGRVHDLEKAKTGRHIDEAVTSKAAA